MKATKRERKMDAEEKENHYKKREDIIFKKKKRERGDGRYRD